MVDATAFEWVELQMLRDGAIQRHHPDVAARTPQDATHQLTFAKVNHARQ
jgi:hypothetical protein